MDIAKINEFINENFEITTNYKKCILYLKKYIYI